MAEPGRQVPTGDSALLRAVGFWALAAAIVNVTIGGSIFAMPGTLASTMGASAPLAFGLGALLFAPIVLCFAAAGSRVIATGGPYSYVEAAFGRLPGLAVAAMLWISSVAGSGSLAAALVDQLSHVAPWLGQPPARTLFMLAIYGALVALNAWGVRAGAAAIMAFALAKVAPLVLLAVFGLPYVHAGNFRITQAPSWTAVGSALVLVVFAYSGIETALAPSGEVRDPDRVVPRAALVGIGVVIALYVGLQFVAQGVLGGALAGNDAPLAAVADVVVTGGGSLLVLTASVSLIGCMQGDLLGSSRLLYALARDGFLPAWLGAVNERHHVPVRAVAAHAFVGWLLAAVGSFTTLALVSGGAFCFVYIGCCAAVWRLQRTNTSQTSAPLLLRGGPLIPGIAIVGLLLLLGTLSRAEWLAIGCVAVAVVALYAARRRPPHC